jgi:hypothetical protein
MSFFPLMKGDRGGWRKVHHNDTKRTKSLTRRYGDYATSAVLKFSGCKPLPLLKGTEGDGS